MSNKNNDLKAYFVGWLISWILISGMCNAHLQKDFPRHDARAEREDLGFSVAWAFVASSMWPITLPGVWIAWGFGQDGWNLKTITKEQEA
jgi:hypothetical protein